MLIFKQDALDILTEARLNLDRTIAMYQSCRGVALSSEDGPLYDTVEMISKVVYDLGAFLPASTGVLTDAGVINVRKSGRVVHHKDGNRFNNNPDNIEIVPLYRHPEE